MPGPMDDPQVARNDEPEPEDLGPTQDVSDQQPEEQQAGASPDGSDSDRGRDQRDA